MFSIKNIKRTALATIAALGIFMGSMNFVEARTVTVYEEDPYTGEVIIAQYDGYDEEYYYFPPRRYKYKPNRDESETYIFGVVTNP